MYLSNLFTFKWVKAKSPAGHTQWIPTAKSAKSLVPDAHDPKKFHAPIMFTTDLALKFDPEYRKISERFLDDPEEFEKAFARAWFKLTHRDLGSRSRYLGSMVPKEELIWQDPVPSIDHKLVDAKDIRKLKSKILKSGLSVSDLVKTAWVSAATFRGTDKRGGANGARIRLAPQKQTDVHSFSFLRPVADGFRNCFEKGNARSPAEMLIEKSGIVKPVCT